MRAWVCQILQGWEECSGLGKILAIPQGPDHWSWASRDWQQEIWSTSHVGSLGLNQGQPVAEFVFICFALASLVYCRLLVCHTLQHRWAISRLYEVVFHLKTAKAKELWQVVLSGCLQHCNLLSCCTCQNALVSSALKGTWTLLSAAVGFSVQDLKCHPDGVALGKPGHPYSCTSANTSPS